MLLELGKNSHLPLSLYQTDRDLSRPFIVSLAIHMDSRLIRLFSAQRVALLPAAGKDICETPTTEQNCAGVLISRVGPSGG